MKPVLLIKDKEKKEQVKDMLELKGYSFNLSGLHQWQRDNGMPTTSFITEFEANRIIGID